ncbi:UbiX family flavin prenyltransferase [Periweissella cryptocerci]|uniref:Flavin prenyltransferase UbiX n=1 Tax=Periweissella cryptocerci TaxID=2506420 RepID=A0A4P6YTL3_9LACO|nr:UbiX family flavin prenyltransferase [Periweissella cryptocerci]QBO35997.1 UbiX family flavin prenyltransferase [Periweissella cryptocerci]
MVLEKRKIIIGVTGASGSVYAVDLLRKLKQIPEIEVHGVMSPWAAKNLQLEADISLNEVKELFDVSYNHRDMGAAIASGSFLTEAMVIIPASMKTVASVSYGFSDNLISRAADVMLKEHRKLIMVPRETPLSTLHLENLTKLAHLGVQIIPPMPAFYNHPKTIQEIVEHQTMKILDALEIQHDFGKRWGGE